MVRVLEHHMGMAQCVVVDRKVKGQEHHKVKGQGHQVGEHRKERELQVEEHRKEKEVVRHREQ